MHSQVVSRKRPPLPSAAYPGLSSAAPLPPSPPPPPPPPSPPQQLASGRAESGERLDSMRLTQQRSGDLQSRRSAPGRNTDGTTSGGITGGLVLQRHPSPLARKPASLTALYDFNDIIRLCWHHRELRRPSAQELHTQLRLLLARCTAAPPSTPVSSSQRRV
jgi:hypothetical protein